MTPDEARDIYLLKHDMVDIIVGNDGFVKILYFSKYSPSVRLTNNVPERVDEQIVHQKVEFGDSDFNFSDDIDPNSYFNDQNPSVDF